MILSRGDRWLWWATMVLNAAGLIGYAVTDADSKWGVLINGFFTIVGMLILRADYLARHPDDEDETTTATREMSR